MVWLTEPQYRIPELTGPRRTVGARLWKEEPLAYRLNDRMVEAFKTVVDVGTATAAAEILNTSQSSISRTILRLEEITKVRLFDRIKGRLHTTQEGRILYEEVENSYIGLERIQRTANALRLKQKGHVGIICAPLLSYGFISEAVSQFSQKFPSVTISVESRRSNIIAEMMSAQRFDLAIADYPSDPPGVKAETFAEAELVCMFHKDHRFQDFESVQLQDLCEEPLIAFPPSNPHRKWLDEAFETHGASPNIRAETPMSETAASMVARGMGIAVINPYTATSFLANHPVSVRRIDGAIKINIRLWRPEHRPTSSVTDAFLATLLETRDAYGSRFKADQKFQ